MTVLVDGRPHPERADGVVAISFGQEYGIRFKNKNNRRAVVKFSIDGENVSGGGYIISANGSVYIKRHHAVDKSFRFVELNSAEALMEGKGPNLDGSKGVIEAKFHLECKIAPPLYHPVPYPYPTPYWPPTPYRPVWIDTGYPFHDPSYYCCDSSKGFSSSPTLGSAVPFEASECKTSCKSDIELSQFNAQSQLNEGCTVEGVSTGQNFNATCFNEESNYVVMRVVLRGHKVADKVVITESEEAFCTKCGKKRSHETDMFCGKCGNKH